MKENRCPKWPQKSFFFLLQNGDMPPPRSTYPLILMFWCDAKKSAFLDALPMDQKIEKNWALERQWSPKGLRLFSGCAVPWPCGPQDHLEERPFDHWTIQIGSRHAVGPKARRIYSEVFINWLCILILISFIYIFISITDISIYIYIDICVCIYKNNIYMYMYIYYLYMCVYVYIARRPLWRSAFPTEEL